MKLVIPVCILVLAIGVSGALAGETAPKDLRSFFQMNCAGCHGADGSARDIKGKSLSGTDFTDARWLKGAKDAAMVKTILKGKFFGWAMPAYQDKLSPEEAQRLVTEIIRQAAKGRIIEATPGQPGSQNP